MRCTGIAVVLSAVLVGFTGCGKDDGRVKIYPVNGKVLLRGAPIEGAKVVFYASSPELQGPGMPIPEGTTDADGEFTLRSFDPADGAPAGDFKVTVIWPEPIPPNADQEFYQPKDRLQGKYDSPQKTPLTAPVEQGGGTLPPFELE